MSFQWVTKGFDSFRRGTFGNGGVNLYVSKQGVLQRIYQYDLNHNGYFDLVFANCQNHHEAAPSYLYNRKGERVATLPGQGALSGFAADLNGNGYSDIVIAGYYDMAAPFATADIYFGSSEKYSENRHIKIPAPFTESSCAGDFKGTGKKALAFAMPYYKTVRIFYQDTELGIYWKGYVDLPIEANLITSIDLDNDGYDELIAKKKDSSEITVYWGGENGIDVNNKTVIPELPASEYVEQEKANTVESNLEKRWTAIRYVKAVKLDGVPCLVYSSGKKILFYTAEKEHNLKLHLSLEVPFAMSVAVGDLNNDGYDDIAVACHAPNKEATFHTSFIFLKGRNGFDSKNFFEVKTQYANDVEIFHWQDGRNEVIFGQGSLFNYYTNNTCSYYYDGEKFVAGNCVFEGEDVRQIIRVANCDSEDEVLLINHYARRAVGYDKAFIYWGDENGYSPEHRWDVPCWCGVDSIYADFNDDGWAEVLICNNSENSVHLDPGCHLHYFDKNGYIADKTEILPTVQAWGGFAADINRDGYLDIVIVDDNWNDISIFYGSEKGFTRKEKLNLNLEGGGRWIIGSDLNKNGYIDIIVPLISKNYCLILHGSEKGYSLENSTKLAVYKAGSVHVADLTGNGYPDIIIGTHIDTPVNGELPPHEPHVSYIYIYWNGPEGLSEFNSTMLRADAATSVAVADFNNDGFLDIFVGNYHNGKERDINSILYWNRNGKFAELDRDLLYCHSASGCLAADFNNDGYIDLAVANHKIDGDHHGYSTIWWNGEKGFNSERTINLPTEGPHGMTAIEPGNQLDRGPEEYYESEVWEVPETSSIISIDIEGEIPENCYVKSWVKVADCKENLAQKEWQEVKDVKVNKGDCMQYRLALGAKNSLRTPRIVAVTVKFA